MPLGQGWPGSNNCTNQQRGPSSQCARHALPRSTHNVDAVGGGVGKHGGGDAPAEALGAQRRGHALQRAGRAPGASGGGRRGGMQAMSASHRWARAAWSWHQAARGPRTEATHAGASHPLPARPSVQSKRSAAGAHTPALTHCNTDWPAPAPPPLAAALGRRMSGLGSPAAHKGRSRLCVGRAAGRQVHWHR